MNKTEFIKAVAAETGATQKAVKEMLEAAQNVAYAEMAKCEEVKIFDGVTLLGKAVPEREARNPQTGEAVIVPEHIAPKAKFGKTVKDYLKG